MSTAVVLVRILAALAVSGAPAAAVAGAPVAISTGDAAAFAPGQVENTGGNVVLGTPGPSETPPPVAVNNHAPVVPAPGFHSHARVAPVAPHTNADALVAKARKHAEEARQLALALAEEARRRAAEAQADAHARADGARQQGHAAHTTSD